MQLTLTVAELAVFSFFSALRSSSCFDYSNNEHNYSDSVYDSLENEMNYITSANYF